MDNSKVHPDTMMTTTNSQNGILILVESEVVQEVDNQTEKGIIEGELRVQKDESQHECDDTCKFKFPLHCDAAESNYDNFVKTLKSCHLDLTERDCKGDTILMKLCQHNIQDDDPINEEMVEMFMRYVTAGGHLDTAEAMTEFVNMTRPTGERNTALHHVAENQNARLVEMLLSYGADASIQNDYKCTPLHLLKERHSDDAYACTELLLDSMPNKDILNNLERSVLGEALFCKTSAKTIQMMIDKGCSARPMKEDPMTGEKTQISILHTAMQYECNADKESLECLGAFVKALTSDEINMKYTGPPDANKTFKGRTALHLSAYFLLEGIMEKLLTHEKIDIFATDDDGRTSLHLVADNGWNSCSADCVEMLMKKAGSVKRKKRFFNMTDSAGETALDITIRRDSVPLSRVILLSHPESSDEWLTKEMFRRIYYKVPEIFLPILDESISFEDKNYEANDEKFAANCEELIGYFNNPYEDEYPEVLNRETDYLAILLESPYVKKDELESFLSHPIVSLFILLKWEKLRILFWCGMFIKILWLTIYMIFVINVFWVSFPYGGSSSNGSISGDSKEAENKMEIGTGAEYLNTWQNAVGIILVVTNVLIFVFKLVLSCTIVGWKKTLTGNLLVHFIFACFVCVTITSVCITGVNYWHHIATAVSIIVISFIGMWELRDLPFIGIYADVFFIALKNLLRLMIAFLPLLIGFSIAISLMLRGNTNFPALHWNVIKILVMMLGEINFDEIFYKEYNPPFRPFAVLIVALFVITVPIVMFNLLLGFTISDVQALESEGELKVLISTLEQIILIERLVLSVAAQKLLSKNFLWRFLLERKEWSEDCLLYGRKLQIQVVMEEIPSKIRRKIRELARKQQTKIPN